MIDASVLMKNSHDRHLNVFWQYDGRPWLENNITKAFINTFDSLSDTEKRAFLLETMNISVPATKTTYSYYLQTSPDASIIRQIPSERKLLFAFSPTGKSWGDEGIDTGDIESIKNSIRKSLYEYYTEDNSEEIEKRIKQQLLETIQIIENRGDSIPDAWIVIYQEEIPYLCIACENKLHDLDPYQLNNHCIKSLKTDTNQIIYSSYEKILETLQKSHSYLVDEFLRYMYYLNYWEVHSLVQLKGMDSEHITYYAERYCKDLLKNIGNRDVEWHRGWGYKFNTSNDFNRMVGLHYSEKGKFFEIRLYFGSTQKSAYALYQFIRENGYETGNRFILRNSFHFQYLGTGKNISDTYYDDPSFDINAYMDFWSNNIDSIHQSDKSERHKLLEKMKNGDIIPASEYERILQFSDSYDNKLNVCPEFGVYQIWNLDDAIALDKNSKLAESIKRTILDIYKQFHIPEVKL